MVHNSDDSNDVFRQQLNSICELV